MAHQAVPDDLPNVLDLYVDTSNFDWSSTRHHYGSWIFLQYLMERKDFGIEFVNNLWLKPGKFQDEDAVLKTMRLGKLDANTWADLFGDYAKRNVTFDSYSRGRKYREALEKHPARFTSRSKTYLEKDPSVPGWYRCPYYLAPQQNAYDVVPLQPTGKTVSVAFQGLVDPERKSAWRNTLVVVDDSGAERFSPTWNQGERAIQLKPTEHKVFLVVAGTPGVFKHIKFLEDQRTQDRFPYRVRVRGAEPQSAAPIAANAEGAAHGNGGGFVAATAKVDPTAFVGPHAKVLGRAQVSGNARVEDWAVIDGDAIVSENAVVGGCAYLTDHVKVAGNARVNGNARLFDGTVVDARARVFGSPRTHSRAHIHGRAIVKDQAIVWGGDVAGDAIMMGGADPGGGVTKCVKGLYTSFVGQEDCDKAADSGGLVADYDFAKPHAFLLRDRFGSNEGLLVGAPKWRIDGLELAGPDGVELPAWFADLRTVEFSLSVRRRAGAADQRLLEFSSGAGDALWVSPKLKSGKAGFVLRRAGVEHRFEAASAMPADKWIDVRVVCDGSGVALYFDGAKVADSGQIGFAPETLRADVGYLGCGPGLRNGFIGTVRKLTVSRGELN
jgi:carbonic anhydrase/acetyltransferase-like protein (isoleucine patch superfamily)